MCAPAAATRRLELADIFRAHGDRLDGRSSAQRRAARAIVSCRTAALGGHLQECDHCGHRHVSYNSCRDRHCPKCQSLDQARWVEARKADLLPVPYFHVVFTVPDELSALFLSNQRIAYGLLFAAVAETLQEVALNPKRLGAKIGFTAVLHTWTQVLLYHPHIHCIVPGGGLDPSGKRWISSKPDFFLPVRVLSKVFRGKLLSKFEAAIKSGEIRPAVTADADNPLERAARKKWVVYCKRPFAGPEQVVAYLGRYTHRIAISNERLVSLEHGRVTFRWKDRAHHDEMKLLTLDAEAFLRRFLLHVVPKGMVRIRHYGLLANAKRRKNLATCRELLHAASPPEVAKESWQDLLLRLTGRDPRLCPRCHVGTMVVIEELPAVRPWTLPGRGKTA
jgi:hypothetical protein